MRGCVCVPLMDGSVLMRVVFSRPSHCTLGLGLWGGLLGDACLAGQTITLSVVVIVSVRSSDCVRPFVFFWPRSKEFPTGLWAADIVGGAGPRPASSRLLPLLQSATPLPHSLLPAP